MRDDHLESPAERQRRGGTAQIAEVACAGDVVRDCEDAVLGKGPWLPGIEIAPALRCARELCGESHELDRAEHVSARRAHAGSPERSSSRAAFVLSSTSRPLENGSITGRSEP